MSDIMKYVEKMKEKKTKNKFFETLSKRGQRKGELTTQQIVGLVILITSFAVILILLFRLNLGEETDKELCRNSVLLKGKSLLAEATPLNCYRSYKCITADGSCEGLNSPEIVEVENIDEIYNELANEMSECWWMFGEGKVDYIGDGLTKNNYCSICSQILFDNSLESVEGVNDNKISKDELYDYLAINKKPGDEITYSEYLLGTKDIGGIRQEFFDNEGVDTFGNIDVGKQFFVVMGITNEVTTTGWVIAGAAGAGLGLLIASNPIGWVTGGLVLGVGSLGAAIGGAAAVENIEPHIVAVTIPGKGIDNSFLSPTVVEANSEKFEALNCEEILTYN